MGKFFAKLCARISIQNFQFTLVPVSYTCVKSLRFEIVICNLLKHEEFS
jgi:hypothetical protein